jgi:hypothetical protein
MHGARGDVLQQGGLQMSTIVHVNKSTLLTESQALRMSLACDLQLRNHAAPAWGIEVPKCDYAVDEKHLPEGDWQIVLMDDSDQAGVLGYHDLSPLGQPYARVFVRDSLDNGGLWRGVCVTLSHETLELVWDPNCDLYKPAADGYEYAKEAADAVEADSYPVEDGDEAHVSNFVLDAFFDPSASDGVKFDYMGLVRRPFETRPGGYQIRRDPKTGAVDQVYGENRAAWRSAGKSHSAARTARRARAA